jgi:hypothetical protein
MGIFRFLKPPPHHDTRLGVLVRRGDRWQGMIALPPDGETVLRLAGGRAAPDESGLMLARELAARYPALRPAIAQALFDHYKPHREVMEAENAEELKQIPRLDHSDQVWKHVSMVRVSVEPMNRLDTVEIAYRTDWDDEHTVGARFQDWALVELNGSVI